jgi:predicted SAM-dependent methyltransferase
VDLHAPNEPDIVADIRYPIAGLTSSSVDHVSCNHVLEHMHQEDWRLVLREVARLLRSGGTFELRMPHPQSSDAMIHGHVHVMTPTFWRDVQSGRNKLDADTPLEITEIVEIENELCHKFADAQGIDFEAWAPFMFNAYTETVVRGWKR